MSREEIIRRIVQRDLQQREMTEECVRQEEAQLHEAACEHFGAWEIALEYAGVSLRRVRFREEFTAERTIGLIRKLCISGGKLKAMHIKQRHRPLYVAARTHFGTWRAALEASGINPEHAVAPCRRITRQEVVEVIRQRHQSRLSLVRCDVFCANRACVVAAKHLFGNWSKALIAAGISPEEGRRPGNQY